MIFENRASIQLGLRWFFLITLMAFSPAFSSPKLTLLNDTSSWYHWGCSGTSTALKERMQQLGYEVNAVPINTIYALKSVPSFEAFDDHESYTQFCEQNREILEKIQSADAVVITGEGTIHDLRTGPMHLLYLAHVAKKFFGKHVEIINHSAYPNDDPILSKEKKSEKERERARHIYRTIYSEVDFIAIRESQSRKEMEKIGIHSTLSFDCLPLYIKEHYFTPKVVKEKNVLVAGSAAFTNEGAEKICRYLEILHEKGYHIQVLVGAAAFPAPDDKKFVAFLDENCQAPWELIEATSLDEWLDTINQAAFLLSGRFHYSIAAFCLNTPFIALNSNTYKVHAICDLLGQKRPFLFSDPLLLEHLFERTDSLLTAPRGNNEALFEEICRLAEKNFDGLRQLDVNIAK
ncbi:MAG: polysaccharide pyruvyl transferase family protein [Chlamydiales bacterium]